MLFCQRFDLGIRGNQTGTILVSSRSVSLLLWLISLMFWYECKRVHGVFRLARNQHKVLSLWILLTCWWGPSKGERVEGNVITLVDTSTEPVTTELKIDSLFLYMLMIYWPLDAGNVAFNLVSVYLNSSTSFLSN